MVLNARDVKDSTRNRPPKNVQPPVTGVIPASGNSGRSTPTRNTPLVPFTSPWWLERLSGQLDARAQIIGRLRQYYAGQQPLAYASQKFRDAFGPTYSRWSDNFMKMVIQATEERLTVTGFNWPIPDADPLDHEAMAAGDRAAWDLWQDNKMDAQSQKAHRDALLCGDCSIIVAPGPKSSAIIRVQKPEEVVVAYADDPLERAVAMKRWTDPTDRVLATLYYPDRIEKYQQATDADSRSIGGGIVIGDWIPRLRLPAGEAWPLPHSLGVVPVVPLVNDPDIDNQGTSEIESLLPLQDALNKIFVDMLVASEYAAFRQRWATGIEIPTDPETGKAIEPFKSSVERIWSTAVADAKFGDFEQTDVQGMLNSIAEVIQHIATQTRTPAHYLLGNNGVFPSGESLRATETGLVAKAKRRMRDFGEAWEEVMGLAFLASGQTEYADIDDGETQWEDPEYRTESEHVAALVQLASLGVPRSEIWLQAGYSPQKVSEWLSTVPDAAAPQAQASSAGTDAAAPPNAAGDEGTYMTGMASGEPDVVNEPPSVPDSSG